MERLRMLCTGSFRAKTVQKTDDHKIVKINGTEYKLQRSWSLNKEQRNNRKIFCSPPILPEGEEPPFGKRVELKTVRMCEITLIYSTHRYS